MSLTIGFGLGGRLGGGGDALAPTTTMTLSNSDSPDPVGVSQNITYTVQVTVTGAADAVLVTVTITLDAALAFVSNSGTGWSLSRVGQVVTATANALPGSAAAPAISVVATAPAGATTVTTGAIVTAQNATQQTANASTTVTAGISGVTRDTGNNNYYPADNTEWGLLMAAAPLATGNPGNVWQLQGAGNAADTGTPGGCTLTNTFGAPQSAITGLTRVGYKHTADGGIDKKLLGTTGAPNPRVVSTIVLAYIDFGATPASTRDLLGVQTGAIINFANSGKLSIVAGATTQSVNTYNGTKGWIAMQTNITASSIILFTELEKLVGTFVLPNNGSAIWLGGHTGACSLACHPYAVEFNGSAAELTSGQMKTLFLTLGASSIPWS